uniref:Plastid lipid-associated protein/fibrillin conserved domain-containing protein n=1 Tax=Eucampia antarctica TaxID=49252 RepID=A0A7S2SD72_9STRA|mmetsp:Transcript_6320/g.5922  ORF Transcript_6320/g.5922 Transcript_6320/m.5922 type:complete len:299 (+) Transcript_6320:58-954(+)
MNFVASIILLALFNNIQTNAFGVTNNNPLSVTSCRVRSTSRSSSRLHSSSSAPSDVDDSGSSGLLSEEDRNWVETPERLAIKSKLLQLCASYDRGFGASPKARNQVQELVDELESMNPTPRDAARGINGGDSTAEDVPLKGIWRMVWTTALDVLTLGASPVAVPGAIYQAIDPPIATNIIDFIPRVQSLLPISFPPSLLRAEVKTRTSLRPQNSNRVGLNFEAVKLIPIELLGVQSSGFLPPFSINFPSIPLQDLPGVDPSNSPGFFDVTYLDHDMLIIKQNDPGGYFVSIKVDDCDP